MENTHDIYDRIAKRCLSLSTRCTVNLINGLFNTDYPVDSKVTYNWTENEDDALRRTLADTIVTINDRHSYHIEFQMTKEGDIILRVLEYGFHHAMRSQTGFEELERKKLIVLLPFQLLRLRQAIEKERTKENMEALKNLVTHDILDSLKRNEDAGNITHIEAGKLSRMILYLYHHIYDRYEELQGVNQMAEEALIFDVDILDYELQKITKQAQMLEEEKQKLTEHTKNLEAEKQLLSEHSQNLEAENLELTRQAQGLEAEKQLLSEHSQNLEAENLELTRQAQGLATEKQLLSEHTQSLEAENLELTEQTQNLESENQELAAAAIRLIRMLSESYTPQEIVRQTGLPLEQIEQALHSQL